MRVIAGSARSLRLKTVEGMDTRPTTDRIKETLFNMISNDLYGCRFLDLFAGSGAIGIEALSRGAKYAVFIEQGKDQIQCIKDNLKFTKLEENANVIMAPCEIGLKKLEGEKPFDIIFMDPPYEKGLERDMLDILKNMSIIDEYTTIIFEAKLDTDCSFADNMGYEIIKIKKYKTNMHVFLKIKE